MTRRVRDCLGCYVAPYKFSYLLTYLFPRAFRRSWDRLSRQTKELPFGGRTLLRPVALGQDSGVLPHQLRLAIQLYHRSWSKWMLNKLHRLGYTESYSETQNYKYCFLNTRYFWHSWHHCGRNRWSDQWWGCGWCCTLGSISDDSQWKWNVK